MQRTVLFCAVLSVIMLATAAAQSVLNPDISIIPRFNLSSFDTGSGRLSNPDMTLDELEVAFQAYLNPFARADIFLSRHGTGDAPIEIEEAYATFLRGLPWDLNVRIGKFRTEFGKFNTIHPHAWPFVSTPLMVQRFLGSDGANDLGAGVSAILPTGSVYSRLSVEFLRGGFTQTIDPREESHAGGIGFLDTLGGRPPFAVAARLMSFLPLSDESDMEIGLSALSGVHDPANHLRFLYTNFDLKYKWKPDAYTSFTIQAELLMNARPVADGLFASGGLRTVERNTFGAFAFADYQFLKTYSIGARYDWAQSPLSANDRAAGFALFAGFNPVEETTSFRLEYTHARFQHADGNAHTERAVVLQFLFSMGPHKAHPF